MTETLSDKWKVLSEPTENGSLIAYPEADVKDFIKKLKESLFVDLVNVDYKLQNKIQRGIDKLAGDKLI